MALAPVSSHPRSAFGPASPLVDGSGWCSGARARTFFNHVLKKPPTPNPHPKPLKKECPRIAELLLSPLGSTTNRRQPTNRFRVSALTLGRAD